MNWGYTAGLVLCLVAPPIVGVLVGAFYRIQFRNELDQARALSRQLHRELDEARYELQQLQEAVERAEVPLLGTTHSAIEPSTPRTSGRNRLRERAAAACINTRQLDQTVILSRCRQSAT